MTTELFSVGRKVRTFLEQDDFCWCSDLTGACAIGSFLVWKLLHKHEPTLVVGDCPSMGHCWVKVKGKVVDVTATQFGKYPPVLILPVQKYSKLSFVKEFTTKYKDREGLKNLRELWPSEQVPWTYNTQIYKHFGIRLKSLAK